MAYMNQPEAKLSFGSKSSASGSVYSQKQQTKQFKIICVGESMVGKTSLIQRYIENSFNDHGT